jgi:uncharacterized protein (TIGR03382 family)
VTQLERHILAFTAGAATSLIVAALSLATYRPDATPDAMVAFAVAALAFLLLTRRRKRRPVRPEPCCCGRPGCDGRGPWPGETT